MLISASEQRNDQLLDAFHRRDYVSRTVEAIRAKTKPGANNHFRHSAQRTSTEESFEFLPPDAPAASAAAALNKKQQPQRQKEGVVRRDATQQLLLLLQQKTEQRDAGVREEPAPDLDSLVSVLFLHRHGARTSAVIIDDFPNWDSCTLSPQGKEMARQLGRYLRGRYGAWRHFPATYDPVKIASWSTDFERTIRTGTALLQAMFETPLPSDWNDTDIPPPLPYLKHLPSSLDFELSYYYSWPSAHLHQIEINSWYTRNNEFAQALISPAEFDELAKFLGVTALCKDRPALCALVAQDFYTCQLSNKPAGVIPAGVHAIKDKLFTMYAKNLHFIYFSRPESTYFRGIAFYGIMVLRDMFKKARQALADDTAGRLGGSGVPVVHHYSAHDNTVYGLLVALGVVRADTTLFELRTPPFTTAVILELYRNQSLRFVYSTCDQEYGSSFQFTQQPSYPNYTLSCMRPGDEKTGTLYRAPMCPLDDVERALNYTIHALYPATSDVMSETMCFADPMDINATNCTVDTRSSADGRVLGNNSNAQCEYWRRECATVACSRNWIAEETLVYRDENGTVRRNRTASSGNDVDGDGASSSSSFPRHVWNETDSGHISCVPVADVAEMRSALDSAGSKAGVFIAALLLGIVFGSAMGAVVMRRRGGGANEADETRNLLKYAEADAGHGAASSSRP